MSGLKGMVHFSKIKQMVWLPKPAPYIPQIINEGDVIINGNVEQVLPERMDPALDALRHPITGDLMFREQPNAKPMKTL